MEIGAHAVAGVVPFSALDGWPLRSGFVERLPGSGRRVFARERYVLDGAVPDGELEVRLLVHLFDPTCSNRPVPFAATPLRTDAAGNGTAELAVRLEDVPAAVRGAAHGVRWEIRRGSVALYRTDCTRLEID
jgi:hypothetical protein